MKHTREQIATALVSKGHAYFENGDLNLNIVMVRTSDDRKSTNKFDDLITLSYKENGNWVYKEWAATTDPGKHWMTNPMSSGGTAILVPGQYRGSHIIRKHQGKYEALCQDRPVKVYRDANRDLIYDEKKITEGVYGINIHKAGSDSSQIDKWSAGCQVFKRSSDFGEFMSIVNRSKDLYGNRFTVTLITSNDLK